MLFNSVEFIIFFPIVILLYFLIPLKHRWIFLLIASYFFYMCWNPQYALLMFFSTISTWFAGLMIGRINERTADSDDHNIQKRATRNKRLWLAASLLTNLLILAFFKYFNFMASNANLILQALHISFRVPAVDVLLPVGISFYTFQALGYSMDVYQGKVTAERNLWRYALFVSFFPQLVAGPIERTGNLLKQVNQGTRFSFENFRRGMMLMLWGMFVKMVIADNAAVFVDAVYNHYKMYSGFTLVVGTVMFALQIYCDFSGYSLIAIGAAEVLGFRLCKNFNQPYFATSVADFWRRWHMSLSTWFRDYLYIPLGGSRCSTLRRYFNLMITFLVSGLWHGAAWHFIIWGALNGLMQIIGDMRRRSEKALRAKLSLPTKTEAVFSTRLLQTVITFILICVTWVFFRADSLSIAVEIIKRFFTFNPWVFIDGSLLMLGLSSSRLVILLLSIVVLFCVDLLHENNVSIRDIVVQQQLWFRWLLYLAGIMSILYFGVYGANLSQSAFIYFQF